MFLIKTTKDLEILIQTSKIGNKKIGFVATMGALHEGHISLIERSKSENDTTICSIFVNPKQFNEATDLSNYPRPIEKDIIILEKAGCNILFLPTEYEIYPQNNEIDNIEIGHLANTYEGLQRPGHFKGVAMVVKKLFEYIKPHKAYFGQKDFQQTLVVKQLVKQFDLDIEIVIHPTIREKNGLAMSSRNIRLTDKQRTEAGFLYKALSNLRDNAKKLPLKQAFDLARMELTLNPNSLIEYFDIVDSKTLLSDLEKTEAKELVAIVVVNYFGVRLLDNIILD